MSLLALFIALALPASVLAQGKSEPVRIDTGTDLLWKKLETRVAETADRMDGVMGVAILDLTDGRILLHNADRVFPTASSIKIAILLELYRQDQEAQSGAKGKGQLDDIYTFDPKDLVEDSRIMAGLTPGVTRVTTRDLAQFMVAVSDNAAARRGDENVATPQEMARLLEAIYKGKALSQQATAEFIKQLSTKKSSYIPRYLPESVQVANKPGELEAVR